MTFEDVCRRWGFSPYSSHSDFFDILKKKKILKGDCRPYKVDEFKLLTYEHEIGFEPDMVSIEEYRRRTGLSQYQVKKLIQENKVKSCILFQTKKQITYRIK